jgi:hypothetical protein
MTPGASSGSLFGYLRRPVVVTWMQHLLLLILVGGFVVKGFIPGWKSLNSDFPNYYLVARLYRAGYPLERVYDWTWLQRQKDHQGIPQGLVSFIPSTLLSALPILPWSSLSALEAKHAWMIANLVFLCAILLLLTRMTALGWERAALLLFLAFTPLRNNFLLGQMHVLVLLLLALGAWLYFRGRHFASGVSLAIAGALKIYPALFLILFLWKKQWRAAAGLVAGAVACAALSLYLFGCNAFVFYATEVLPAGLRGESLDPYSTGWNSLTALLRRLLIYEPELNPSPVAHLPHLYAILQPLVHAVILVGFLCAIGSRNGDEDRQKLEWGAFLFLLLLISSQPGSYHFVALVLTAALVGDHLLTRGQCLLGGLALFLYCLICSPVIRWHGVAEAGWQNLLFFPRLAFMMILGGLLLWILAPPVSSLSFRSVAPGLSLVAALTLFGFLSTEHHLKGQFDNYKARIAVTPGNIFASNPAITSSDVLFTVMEPGRYTIRGEKNGRDLDLPGVARDWFHAAVAQDAGQVWLEQATAKGSEIIRLESATGGSPQTLEVSDGQEPVISHDGQLLAFIRETSGGRSLWIRKTESSAGGTGKSEPVQIAAADYDVHEVTFLPDRRLIFSSLHDGDFSLYTATESGAITEMTKPNCPARYPAASADGGWLAYSCRERGRWQLHAMNFESGKEIRFTSADCNSVSPAWTADSHQIIYATDCGRGLGLTALARVALPQ